MNSPRPRPIPLELSAALDEILRTPPLIQKLSPEAVRQLKRYSQSPPRVIQARPREVVQLALDFNAPRYQPPVQKRRRRGSRPQAKYPFEMVLEARKMRKYEFTYVEIAKALNDHWKTNVHWVTVRDWVHQYWRVIR